MAQTAVGQRNRISCTASPDTNPTIHTDNINKIYNNDQDSRNISESGPMRLTIPY